MICIAAKTEFMFRSFLPLISASPVFMAFFTECMDSRASKQPIEFSEGYSDAIRSLLDVMMVEAAERRESYANMLECLFASALILLARSREAALEADKPAKRISVEPIMEYIASNYATLTLAQAASHFNYSPSYLSSVLHKRTGRSFNAIVKEFKLERARKLLAQTDMPVNLVATAAGYPHLGNFHKVFKAAFGVTPNEFRRSAAAQRQEEP